MLGKEVMDKLDRIYSKCADIFSDCNFDFDHQYIYNSIPGVELTDLMLNPNKDFDSDRCRTAIARIDRDISELVKQVQTYCKSKKYKLLEIFSGDFNINNIRVIHKLMLDEHIGGLINKLCELFNKNYLDISSVYCTIVEGSKLSIINKADILTENTWIKASYLIDMIVSCMTYELTLNLSSTSLRRKIDEKSKEFNIDMSTCDTISYLVGAIGIATLFKKSKIDFRDKSGWPYKGDLISILHENLKDYNFTLTQYKKMGLMSVESYNQMFVRSAVGLQILKELIEEELENRKEYPWVYYVGDIENRKDIENIAPILKLYMENGFPLIQMRHLSDKAIIRVAVSHMLNILIRPIGSLRSISTDMSEHVIRYGGALRFELQKYCNTYDRKLEDLRIPEEIFIDN